MARESRSFRSAPYERSGSSLRLVDVGLAQVYDLLVMDPGAVAAGAGSDVGASYRLSGTRRVAAEDERLGLLAEIFDQLSRRRRSVAQAGREDL
jgi:hypothetical protein